VLLYVLHFQPTGWRGLAFSRRERAARDGIKNRTILRPKRSDSMRVLGRHFGWSLSQVKNAIETSA
jgi:hypothetical protein